MPAVEIRGSGYYVELAGKGEPLLLLHGFTGSSQNWQPLLPALADRFQVIAPDLLGHGRSDSPTHESRYTMDEAASDLMNLMDEWGYTNFNLLGYSMGGRLALYTAVTYPHRISRLILESASPGLSSTTERQERVARDRELAAWIEAQGIETFVNRWEQLPLWASQEQLSPETRQRLRQQRLQNNPVGLANSLRGVGTGVQPSLWEQLAELSMPVLLIVGELDEKFAAINQQMVRQIPGAQLEIVMGAGHTVHLERPSLFLQIVLAVAST